MLPGPSAQSVITSRDDRRPTSEDACQFRVGPAGRGLDEGRKGADALRRGLSGAVKRCSLREQASQRARGVAGVLADGPAEVCLVHEPQLGGEAGEVAFALAGVSLARLDGVHGGRGPAPRGVRRRLGAFIGPGGARIPAGDPGRPELARLARGGVGSGRRGAGMPTSLADAVLNLPDDHSHGLRLADRPGGIARLLRGRRWRSNESPDSGWAIVNSAGPLLRRQGHRDASGGVASGRRRWG